MIWDLNNCIRHPNRKQVLGSLARSSPEPNSESQPFLGGPRSSFLQSQGTRFPGKLACLMVLALIRDTLIKSLRRQFFFFFLKKKKANVLRAFHEGLLLKDYTSYIKLMEGNLETSIK